MFQITDQITDEYGNARLNWQLEAFDLSTGDPVTMYADYAGTIPIENVSFIENRLVSDRFGNFTGGYVTPGTYGKRYYDDQGVLKRTVEGLDMYGSGHSAPVAVTSLPAAATAGAGARSMVTDATVTTFASIVAGGGANAVPVFSDGTNWRIG